MQSGHLAPEFAPDVAAFGHTLAAGEPPDHLAIEPACFDYLKVKQALTPACGDPSFAAPASAATCCRKDLLTVMADPITNPLPTFAPGEISAVGTVLLQHLGSAPRSSYPIPAPATREEADEEFLCGIAPR